jgi:hypothetical protein
LRRHWWCTRPAHGRQFRRLRPYIEAASTTVVGDAVVVVDDHSPVINIGDSSDIDPVDRAVVVEVVSVPIAAVVAVTGIPEAIIDPAVEADMRSPEATMKAITAAIEAPVARRPECAVVGWSAPCARNPVVACRNIAPVAGGPKIVGLRSFRLLVDGQRRRRLICIFGRLTAIGISVELVIVLSVLCGLIV